MPTYEYRCKECGEQLEVVQAFTDDPLTECPACGGPLRKVFGNIGVTFKGSGFYRTDSRAGASSKAASNGDKTEKTEKADTAAGSSSDSTTGGKADTSSTTKSDSASSSSGKPKSSDAA